jgi:membrane-anchored protein YejM (alkaline phosphatase superfamily)
MAVVITNDRASADRAASYDPSFRLISELIMPADQPKDDDLYQVLLANTNIARERQAQPIDVVFDPGLAHSDAALPNVFVIVIDSLRRDYVSPFNAQVTFTPRIAEFAKDGVAFTNAFTRYGATGLSEPSIWVGGMLLHKQYVTPFASQNALQKLLVAERYRQFVSVDSILRVLFPPDLPLLTELDRGRSTKDYDLCTSLPELQQQLDGAKGSGGRVFAYTQPQNLHISTITRQNGSVPGGGTYPGFYAPYASRVRQVDTCFGTFVDYLKASGLYDSSIVIFAADHGDSLGEEGRFGHAYTVFPEIMRIPLIVKLPGDQSRLKANQHALVFSSDLTPTLYELLGHRPPATPFPFGRSLVADAAAAPIRRTDPELVASSYGAVYGVVENEGRRIYIADAVNFQDYVYDLSDPLTSRRTTISPDEAAASRKAIRDGVETIRKVYRFGS